MIVFAVLPACRVRRFLAAGCRLRAAAMLLAGAAASACVGGRPAVPLDPAEMRPASAALRPALPKPAFVLEGRVARVGDGDTLTLITGTLRTGTLRAVGADTRIRLSDIDAPETALRGFGRARLGQPYAQASRRALTGLALGHAARAECYERDRYRRAVCHVFVGFAHLNREQLRGGWAWAYRTQPRYVRDPDSARIEAEARRSRRGLWRDRAPVPPWRWRAGCRDAARCGPDAPS